MKITRFHKNIWIDFDKVMITLKVCRWQEFLFGFSFKNDMDKFILFTHLPFTEFHFMLRKGKSAETNVEEK